MGYNLIDNKSGESYGYFKSRNKCREFAEINGQTIGDGPDQLHWEECPAPPTDHVEDAADNGDDAPQ